MKPFKIAEIYRRKLDSVKNATGKSNHSEFQISTCKMCVSPRKRLERDTKNVRSSREVAVKNKKWRSKDSNDKVQLVTM